MKKFYIGASPIGGIDDITKRTLDVIKKADYIVCELEHVVKQTAKNGKWETNAKYIGYCVDHVGDSEGNRNSEFQNHGEIKNGIHEEILKLIKEDNLMIYLPERGSVGIEDPGGDLIQFLKENYVDVVILPGVDSVTASLISSGIWPNMESHRAFTFQPLVDLDVDGLEKIISQYKDSKNVLIFQIHDPEMLDGLKLMEKYYGKNTIIAMCQNVSLMDERIEKTTIGQLIEKFDPKLYYEKYTTIVVDGIHRY
jgi:16S rRNA (cytidine1402-2'-O)-methyltransferase